MLLPVHGDRIPEFTELAATCSPPGVCDYDRPLLSAVTAFTRN